MRFLVVIRKERSSYQLRERIISFFLIQAVSRITLIIFISIQTIINTFFSLIITRLIIVNLILKLGMSPLHNWILPILYSTKYYIFWLLIIIQKLPYYLVFFFSLTITPFILFFACINLVIATRINIKQTEFKTIIILSRIRQISWFLISLFSLNLFQFFLLNYRVIFLFIRQNREFTNKNLSNLKILFLLTIIRGVPPFFIFLPKLLLLNWTLIINLTLLISLLIFFNLIDIYIYIRFSLNRLIKKIKLFKINLKPTTVKGKYLLIRIANLITIIFLF